MASINTWESCQICYFHIRATCGCQKWAVPNNGKCPYFEICARESERRTFIDSDIMPERGQIVFWDGEEFELRQVAPDKLHAYGMAKTRGKILKTCECKLIR